MDEPFYAPYLKQNPALTNSDVPRNHRRTMNVTLQKSAAQCGRSPAPHTLIEAYADHMIDGFSDGLGQRLVPCPSGYAIPAQVIASYTAKARSTEF